MHTLRAPCIRRTHTRSAPTLCFLFLLCLFLELHQSACASLIATSKIQYCRRDGSVDAAEPAGCARKMVVTLTIDSGQLSGVEDVVFVSSAADETGSSESGSLVFEPLRLSTSRTPVVYSYPVFFTHNYNAKPFEENIGGSLFRQCNADFNPKTATCGISTDSQLQPVPYSQGFCCDCGACASLGLCEADWRASNACNLFQTYTTASCLRFAELSYSGYTLGPMQTSYDITLTFATNTSSSANTSAPSAVEAELHLSPVTPEDSSISPGVLARLVGDFASPQQPWDFTNTMLFIPAVPRTHERVAAGVAEYMLVPSNAVSVDGRTCNKIGVSYEAFASQGNACRLSKGSCLAGQLEDYRNEDMAAMAANRAPRYFASTYGNFSIQRVANGSPYLAYQATSAGTSMITVTLNADDIQFVVSVSPGKLVSVAMNVETIRASSRDGVLEVTVQNTGTLSTRYVVAVPTCTEGIFPITAQVIFLAADETRALNFSVLVQDINMQTDNASCNVTLRNQDILLDSSVVQFNVSATVMDNGPQGGGDVPGGEGTWKDGVSNNTCSQCSFLNLKCTFGQGCAGLIAGQLATMLAILAALIVLFKLRRYVCCCLPCFGRSSKGKTDRDRSPPRRHRRSRYLSMGTADSGERDSHEHHHDAARDGNRKTKQSSASRSAQRACTAPASSRALVRVASSSGNPPCKHTRGSHARTAMYYPTEPFGAPSPLAPAHTFSAMYAVPQHLSYSDARHGAPYGGPEEARGREPIYGGYDGYMDTASHTAYSAYSPVPSGLRFPHYAFPAQGGATPHTQHGYARGVATGGEASPYTYQHPDARAPPPLLPLSLDDIASAGYTNYQQW